MFLSAVSVAIASSIALNGTQLGPAELAVWGRISPSVVVLLDDGEPMGAAALIDASGLFVAHQGAVPSAPIRGRSSSGAALTFVLESKDEPSQLVLLRAVGWVRGPTAISLAMGEASKGERLIAALGRGPMKAEFVSSDRVGILSPSRRVVQLNEIRFEAPAESVGGALVFSLRGELIGALNATLGQVDEPAQKAVLGALNRDLLPKPLVRQDGARFGPAPLTVAYTVGPAVMRRVIAGFKSATHEVQHPSIGVFCRDAAGGGAVVEMVQAGAPAHLAGLRPGDVIFELGGQTVKNQFDFARIVFEQEVGAMVILRVRRGPSPLNLAVRVGKLAE